jgi:alkanesulfonate monooxygenase SsuD/methylene tetrahydromethanopterin reductase-like flavin-dependent oxidoreductase (luciferase family)
MPSAKFYAWHFMAYPYLPDDFDEKYDTGWVTVPNKLWDSERSADLYQEYIDQLAYAEDLGFDGYVLNEHHQNVYGLMPSPNIIAAALTQRTTKGQIVVLGNLISLHANPIRIAEEYAMIDMMSRGRLIAGFAVGGGPEAFNASQSSAVSRRRYWEAIDLCVRAWKDDGPFEHEGPEYPLRYVNIWPKTRQKPHPPVWIPGSLSIETMEETAKRGFDYFLSSRVHGAATKAAAVRFADVIKRHGDTFHPFRMGVLLSVYVSETDESARQEASEGVFYFLRNCLKGHLRRVGRTQTFGPGVPSQSVKSWEQFLQTSDPSADRLGDAKSWEELDAGGSIICGSPATVRKRLWELIELAGVGNFLIQFHFGNMKAEHARKSMRLFATEVLPHLRSHSSELFQRDYPQLEQMAATGGVR